LEEAQSISKRNERIHCFAALAMTISRTDALNN
jgi:hypothetical protein